MSTRPAIPGTILVVDDEVGIRDMLAWELGEIGHQVQTVANGTAALELARHTEFDVVISDVRMPGISGLEVLRVVKEIAPDTEVIIVTGHAEIDYAVACVRGGAFDFIQKPFHQGDLFATVSRALERRHLKRTASLLQASQAIFANQEPRRLPQVVVEAAMQALSADAAALLLPANAERALYVAYSKGLPVPEAEVGAIPGDPQADPGASAARPTLFDADDPALANAVSGGRARSSIVYPMRSKDRLVGVLILNRTLDERAFRSEDFARASLFAAQALIALDNLRLLQVMATSERLVAIGQLAAGVAHEINNPIFCILAAQSFLQEQLPALAAKGAQNAAQAQIVSDLQDALTEAQDASLAIRDLVADLRTMSRHGKALSPVRVSDVIRSALRLTKVAVHQRATVTTEIDSDAMVLANPGRLSQVIVNLIVNAAQAIGDDQSRPHTIAIACRCAGDTVIVSVSDTGPGIAPEIASRIFEPFCTTKGEREGTGLGLAISRDIVEEYEGSLSVTSELGHGAIFTISLPAAGSSPASAQR